MERMLAVIFDDEKKAYEGTHALSRLDLEGEISIFAEAVVSKNTDGKLSVKQVDGDFPIRTLGGTAIGSLLGLLGGPIGFGIGAAAGTFAGAMADIRVSGVDGEFLDDVSKSLKPGKFALVADVSEDWVTPVDTRMEALGGTVYRAARSAVSQDQVARHEAAMRAELASLKAEEAKASAERKKRLQLKIQQLESKLQAKLQHDQQQREGLKLEAESKLKAVQQQVAKAQGDAKAALEARVTELRRDYELGTAKRSGPEPAVRHP